MHRKSSKGFADRATEGWFKSLMKKPSFKILISEARDRLKSERDERQRQKIIKKYGDKIAAEFNLRKRNFTPLIEEYIESGMISLNPFELYGVTLINKRGGMLLNLRPGIRKSSLHAAIDLWWHIIDSKMKDIDPAEHKKQFKERKNDERDELIYKLYLNGIIKYTGKLKIGYTLGKLKELGINPVPGIDMRKKIIVRLRNSHRI